MQARTFGTWASFFTSVGSGALTQSPDYQFLALPVAILSGGLFLVLAGMFLFSNRRDIFRLARLIEPSHVIILALVVAFSGAIWQMRRTLSPDPELAKLQTQVGSLQEQLATATAAKSPSPPSVPAPPAPIVESRLRLHFRPENTTPGAEELLNIWRWYALQHIVGFVSPQGKRHESSTWTVFITLDKPMNVAQLRIESNVNLPRYEVKDSDGRSAVIAFYGPVTDAIVDIRFLSTSEPVSPRLEAPPPPKQRPLSTYEAEHKVRAIDSILRILSRDMQPVVDKFPAQQGWWNALKDPNNHPTFRTDLINFRDEFKSVCLKLDSVRNDLPEYQDLVEMIKQPHFDDALKALEKYLVQFMYVQDTVKSDASKEALQAFMDDAMTEQYAAMNKFIGWRNETKSNVLELRRKISP